MVIERERTFQVLAVNESDALLRASPAIAGKTLLLRTKTHLYRVEDQ